MWYESFRSNLLALGIKLCALLFFFFFSKFNRCNNQIQNWYIFQFECVFLCIRKKKTKETNLSMLWNRLNLVEWSRRNSPNSHRIFHSCCTKITLLNKFVIVFFSVHMDKFISRKMIKNLPCLPYRSNLISCLTATYLFCVIWARKHIEVSICETTTICLYLNYWSLFFILKTCHHKLNVRSFGM